MAKISVRAAIIGGTGLYSLDKMEIIDEVFPDTPWGFPSDKIIIGKMNGKEIAFLPRHGKGHFLLPSEIPVMANIAALKSLGVEEIVSFSSVGSLREEIRPRDFVLPSQIIDRTKVRESTFFGNGVVAHVPFAEPFSENLARRIEKAGRDAGIEFHTEKTLVCMEGPAFSTKAESHLYRSWGADLINMSVLPEAKLAREAEIAYQMVCMSTDYDCWKEEEEAVTLEVVIQNLQKNAEKAKALVQQLIPLIGNGDDLNWKSVTRNSIVTSKEKIPTDTAKKLKFIFPDYF